MENQLKETHETNPLTVTSHRKEYNDPDERHLIRDSANSEYDRNSMSEDCQTPEQVDWWGPEEQASSANDKNQWSSRSSKSPRGRSNTKYDSYGHEKSSNRHQDLNNEPRNRENQKKHTSKERQKFQDECRPNEGKQLSSKTYRKQSVEPNEKSCNWRSEQKESNESNKYKSQNKGNWSVCSKSTQKQQFGQFSERSDNQRSSRRNEADEYNRNKFRNSSRDRPKAEGFDEFEAFYKSFNKDLQFRIVHEVEGDLFSAGTDYSLGHCVAEDMKMGSGIAVSFRRDFKRVDELLGQRKTQGNVAILEDQGRYIYYLVTKRESSKKPTYQTLWLSLQKMKDHIIANSVKKLALPRIGCGLDSLEWNEVKAMLEYTFGDVDIEIKIYNFQQEIMKKGYENCNQNVQLRESIEHDILKNTEMRVSRKAMTDVNDLLLETKCTLNEEEDQYDVFGRYIVSQMKRLRSEYLKKKMIGKIEQILLEIREEEKIVIKDPDVPVSRPRKCWVVNDPKPLSEIASGTIMIYFLSKDGYETDEIKSLYHKFPFLRFSVRDISSKILGQYVNIQRNDYNFYGCIVRNSHKDLFSFQDFQKCLNSIQMRNRRDKYEYIAFQAFLENGSELIVEKIVNLISHSMTYVHVYVCWPEDLLKFMPYQHSDKSTS
ncbi:hypothetical protein MML48_1g08476 [Holotrichia oblita]|uniref:Uncharacterized protein n=1 Tax=Holotrichia oblita TaxID=644536 RepID=A0ACB9TWB1_HOLOL|nr:hypothetical protein MML48_1g08476 [Holotrichia oblita]